MTAFVSLLLRGHATACLARVHGIRGRPLSGACFVGHAADKIGGAKINNLGKS